MYSTTQSTELFKSTAGYHNRSDRVLIAAVRHPFRFERILVELPALGSVADLLRAIGLDPDIPARVFLDERMIFRDERKRIYPKPGQILTVRAIPHGGGNSKDTELLTLAIAAVAAVATWGAGALITAELGTTVAVSGTTAAGVATTTTITQVPTWASALSAAAGALVSGAIKFGGQQLINALIPPPKTPVPKQTTLPQSYTVSGTANAAAPFSPIPKLYGARRIFPQYAASPYGELVGENQYLRMLFLLGYGPLDISQIQIGDTAIEDYEEVEWELRAGFADDAPPRLYPGSVAETALNVQLSKTNPGGLAPTVYGWSQVPLQTSGTNADELAVDVSFPGGLAAFSKSAGKPVLIVCPWRIRWAPTGTQNWTYEPVIALKSTAVGTTRAGHVWRVPRGQYDVQATLGAFAIAGNDWTQSYVADGYWTALRTIRDLPPYAMAGLALLAVRIRASRQLSGAINNLNCVAASILPDYDSGTERLDIRIRVAVTKALAMAIVAAIAPQILILAIKLETASRQAGDEHPCLCHAIGLLERPFLACRFIIGTLVIAFLRKRGASTINEKPQGPRRVGAGGICVALTLLGDKAMIHLFLRQAGTPCK